LLAAAVGAALVALGILWSSGTAAADTVATFQSSTPPYVDPSGNTWTDPRGSMANRPGTLVEARYGPFTVNANSSVHNAIDFSAPVPCANCYVTDIVPNLIYDGNSPDGSPNGSTANLNNGAMMHHFVLINQARQDAVCPTGLQGQIGERFFASGNERSELHLPPPYGYLNPSGQNTWVLIYHLVNKSAVDKKLSVQIVYRYRNPGGSPPQPVESKPLWLDIDGCNDSEYTIPTGYSDTHASWTSTVSGRMIGIGGHLHDVDITSGAPCDTHCSAEGGGIAVSAELVGGSGSTYFGPIPQNNPPPADLTGTTLCRSEGYYGTTWAGTRFKGHLDTMSQCGIESDQPAGAQAEAYPPAGAYPASGVPFTAGQVIKLHSEYLNNTGAQQTDVMGIMMAWYAPPDPGYVRPKSAGPFRASLVPAFNQCTGPGNRTHGPPSSFASCNPPVQTSGFLTVGEPTVNGAAANSVSYMRLDPVIGNPATPADEADVRIRVSATDIRKTDLTDYTGQLKTNTSLRIIDRDNGPSEVGVTVDIPLSYTVPCTATGSTTIGSTCSLDTTADAITPNTVKETKRTVWQMGETDVFDGGSDGVASTNPNTLFLRQGYFVP
jgi:hypothetical protein